MDQKISDFAIANTILGTDILPIVSAGLNKSVSASVLALNLPNIGNKGITKNETTPVASAGLIPLTKSIVILRGTGVYTLGAGTDGQTITIMSSVACSVTSTNAFFTTATFQLTNASLTLTFIGTDNKWYVNSANNVLFA